jgi:hypothetical protein
VVRVGRFSWRRWVKFRIAGPGTSIRKMRLEAPSIRFSDGHVQAISETHPINFSGSSLAPSVFVRKKTGIGEPEFQTSESSQSWRLKLRAASAKDD